MNRGSEDRDECGLWAAAGGFLKNWRAATVGGDGQPCRMPAADFRTQGRSEPGGSALAQHQRATDEVDFQLSARTQNVISQQPNVLTAHVQSVEDRQGRYGNG